MRYLFTFVFLFYIFGNVLTEGIPRYKLARLGLALRKLKLHKEEQRKLQMETDKEFYESDETIPPTAAPRPSNSTGDEGKKEETPTLKMIQLRQVHQFQQKVLRLKIKMQEFK